MAFLLVCSFSFAQDVHEFIEKFAKKKNAIHLTLTVDGDWNTQIPAFILLKNGGDAPQNVEIVKEVFKGMGIESLEILSLDSCKNEVRRDYIKKAKTWEPKGYTLMVSAKGDEGTPVKVYFQNEDEKMNTILVVAMGEDEDTAIVLMKGNLTFMKMMGNSIEN